MAAIDKRVKCVVSQVPTISGFTGAQRRVPYHKARLVPGSLSQEWQEYPFPRHTPQGKPIGDGPLVRTIREALAAVVARHGLVMLTKRVSSYYATPQIAAVEIDLPVMPSALVWRADVAN